MTTETTEPAEACTPQTDSHAIGTDVAAVVATTLKALADPLRLRILSFIATTPSGEACVCDLSALTDVSQPTVSHHLKVMRDVGVLTSERRGTWVWYRINSEYRGAVSTLLDSFAPAALAGQAPARTMTGLTDTDAALTALADQLAETYEHVDADTARRIVRESYTALARTARISVHLLTLTERFARQRLADVERTEAATDTRPQVLFLCVANAGRSQLAAALVRHYVGDRVVVRSAGSTPASEVHPGVRPALEALDADAPFPKPLTDDAVRASDVVVTMGCGDVCPVLPGKRYEDWAVGDPALASPAGVEAIRDEIDGHVRALLADLLPDFTA
ncbi:ArsR family transcriptional regulator [Paraoerskovia marina]|uniref:ArsR family transcriptional regulator n=1 Tax=Paraoerskovia marina TaxID=545619 RepID=A0A1H1MGU5_9CELL|nr:metalloregulator ArsR/SmtB family transcription factor [Paraoerskovia marina]SDR85877.1 ArsR family transcriptional regulator [Paraoerskovia marina]